MATPEPPTALAAGALRPTGIQRPGTLLTTTTGQWAGNPDAMRFVWLADGSAVADSGWVNRWSDTYTVAYTDTGKVISANHYARNGAGDSAASPAAGAAVVALGPLPPAMLDHSAVFGPMVSLGDVWAALTATLRTWLPTYLRERERRAERPYASLPSVRGWRVYTSDLEGYPSDQLPLGVIVSPGIPDAVIRNPDGSFGGTLEVGVSIIVSARSSDETLTLAADYGAALRACLEGHPSLGGVAQGLHVIGERYDGLGSEDQRTIAAAEVVASLRLDAIGQRWGGPAVPDPDPPPQPDPGGPQIGTVETTGLVVERD